MNQASPMLALVASSASWVVGPSLTPHHVAPRAVAAVAQEAPPPAGGPPSDYAEAEERGFELYRAREYERAIRMFELAQTLPGAGVDYKRVKNAGQVGSATAPPNPREWGEARFATQQQKLIAQYNIACCCSAMGDGVRALEIVRAYLDQVAEPLDALNEMLVDDDLLPVREGLRGLREELKREGGGGLFAPLGKLNDSMRSLAESVGVEWK